jgi:hypothetical protein
MHRCGRNFTAAVRQPTSLYRYCSDNSLVLLYFFEGNSETYMNGASANAMVGVLQRRIGKTILVGVNRRSIGAPYAQQPVIDEDRGWNGELVNRFHNHRREEIICIDSLATIIYRGEPGRNTLEGILRAAGESRIEDALGEYDRALGGATIIGKTASGGESPSPARPH